jgi:hypothetical protein
MSKFTKIIIVLVFILLIEMLIIYRGYSIKKKNTPIGDKPVFAQLHSYKAKSD